MSDDWDTLAADWDSKDTRLYAECAFDSWNRKVAPLVADLKNSRVLDFGCGTGLLTEKLAPFCRHVVAIDTSVAMIEVVRRKVVEQSIGNITPLVTSFDSAAISHFPELADKFDIVVASSVCSFLPDYESTLRELASVLRSGGLFAQWDWLSNMPVERIRGAFEVAGLIALGIEETFEMTMNNQSMPVVLGIASRP